MTPAPRWTLRWSARRRGGGSQGDLGGAVITAGHLVTGDTGRTAGRPGRHGNQDRTTTTRGLGGATPFPRAAPLPLFGIRRCTDRALPSGTSPAGPEAHAAPRTERAMNRVPVTARYAPWLRAISSAVERCLHTAEATGSKPVSPTRRTRWSGAGKARPCSSRHPRRHPVCPRRRSAGPLSRTILSRLLACCVDVSDGAAGLSEELWGRCCVVRSTAAAWPRTRAAAVRSPR